MELLEIYFCARADIEKTADGALAKTVCSDFDRMYRSFLGQKEELGLMETARAFVDEAAGDLSPADMVELVLGFPGPWVEGCSKCAQSIFKGASPGQF